MPRWSTGPWTATERELIEKYKPLTATQIHKIFEEKGLKRTIAAIKGARTRYNCRSHSEQSRRRNSDARSVFDNQEIETIKNFDFQTRYNKTPCLECQLKDQNKDNYVCMKCQPRHHYAMQTHSQWAEDYGQAMREIWDTMQYASVYVSG